MSENKQEKTVVVKHGMGFCSSLTLMFIAFKLLGIIKFSWLWVLSPLWIPVGLWILFIIIVFMIPIIILGIITLWDFITSCIKDRKNRKDCERNTKEYIDKGILIKRKDGTYGTKEREDD